MGLSRASQSNWTLHDLLAGIALVGVGALILGRVMYGLTGSISHVAGGNIVSLVSMILFFGAYLIVATRRVSITAWVIVGFEGLILGCAAFGTSVSVPVSSTVGVLAGAAIVFVPLLIVWWLTQPRSNAAA